MVRMFRGRSGETGTKPWLRPIVFGQKKFMCKPSLGHGSVILEADSKEHHRCCQRKEMELQENRKASTQSPEGFHRR